MLYVSWKESTMIAHLLGPLALVFCLVGPAVDAQTPAAQVPSPNTAYVIGPSDTIEIRVAGQPDLTTQARVDGDGRIGFPQLGQIAVAGLTQEQMSSRIAAALEKSDIIRRPKVTVAVVGFGRQVSVLGQVGTPGIIPIDRPMTITDILARVGGVKTETAGSYLVLRGTDANGNQTVQKMEMDKLLEGDPSLNVMLKNGDTIYVPQAPEYYLYGYVNKPGLYLLRKPTTVRQAIALAGGLLPTGSESRMRMRRKNSDGSEIEVPIKLEDMVEPGDTLVVPESWF
jgi:polysaccharide export outer membrane protein